MASFVELDAEKVRLLKLSRRLDTRRRGLVLTKLHALAVTGIVDTFSRQLDLADPEDAMLLSGLMARAAEAYRRVSYIDGAERWTNAMAEHVALLYNRRE